MIIRVVDRALNTRCLQASAPETQHRVNTGGTAQHAGIHSTLKEAIG